jgi:hypothetical protein
MKTNLKVILSAIGVAALLASPAAAQQVRPYNAAPSIGYIPNNASGAVAPYWGNENGPYTPSIPTPRFGKSRDFQGGGGDK